MQGHPDRSSYALSPLRFHDLRATFAAWALSEGRGEGWITDRTGQLTSDMLQRYSRAVRTLQDLRYEPFPDISKAVPELSKRRTNVIRLEAARGRR